MRYWLLALPMLFAVSCADDGPAPPSGPTGEAKTPLTAGDVTLRSEVIVDRMVRVSLASQSSFSDGEAWAAFEELLDAIGGFTSDDTVPVEPPPDVPPQADPPAPEEGEPADPQEIAGDINEWLGEVVFSDDNLETSTANSATFLLAGEDLCDSYTVCTPCPVDDPYCDDTCTEEVDADCVGLVNDAEVRIQATLFGEDGIDLAALIGPQRVEVITASLGPNRFEADTDLGEVERALEHIMPLLEDDGELGFVPVVMGGQLRTALTITGDDSFVASWEVLYPIVIDVETELGDFKLTTLDHPAVEVAVDGIQELLTVDLEIGDVIAVLPWALFTDDESDVSSRVSFELAGLSFAFSLSGDSDSVTTDIGLGDATTTIGKDGVTLFELDVNPSAGRSFDLDVAATDRYDSLMLSVAPELNVVAAFELVHILDDFPEIDSFLRNETYELRLWGAGGAAVVPVPDSIDYEGGVHVASGTLQLSSTAAAAPVTVVAGQCLSGVEPNEGEHPILGSLAATACP